MLKVVERGETIRSHAPAQEEKRTYLPSNPPAVISYLIRSVGTSHIQHPSAPGYYSHPLNSIGEMIGGLYREPDLPVNKSAYIITNFFLYLPIPESRLGLPTVAAASTRSLSVCSSYQLCGTTTSWMRGM
ncbi:hypothetical protein FLAG1_05207 [Fusarium langsethiae]|uniref:Uncharacterized protein n=1 Tax=Fusarium langsethiae TaxID=179993 RepID=A0A0N0DF08_FUSLA|nr:hypothetical protein FLAG1_05207 [Fusarium langsethiae]